MRLQAGRSTCWRIHGSSTELFLGSYAEGLERLRIRASLVVVLTDEAILGLHLQGVLQELRRFYRRVEPIVLPIGEQQKRLLTIETIVTKLLAFGADRQTLLVGVGGGVICDIAGFVAATFCRGIPLFVLPTTLLAQVDAALGGKYAINHPLVKNSLGGVRQPYGILLDVFFCSTLPEPIYVAGFAEIMKYGVMLSADFFTWIETHTQALRKRSVAVLEECVWRASTWKYRTVRQDPDDRNGIRMLLNFGHTFGHALESAYAYVGLSHGEAVSIGMVMATQLAESLRHLTPSVRMRLAGLLQSFGLPTTPKGLPNNWESALQYDKKNQAGLWYFVLPRSIGSGEVIGFEPDTIWRWLSEAAYI